MVARGGKIVYEKAYGYAMLNDMGVRLDDPRPMQMDTMFDMASCTKIMATTQSIMKLYSEGKIDLNGSISHTFKLTDAQAAFDFNDTHDPSIRKIALLND